MKWCHRVEMYSNMYIFLSNMKRVGLCHANSHHFVHISKTLREPLQMSSPRWFMIRSDIFQEANTGSSSSQIQKNDLIIAANGINARTDLARTSWNGGWYHGVWNDVWRWQLSFFPSLGGPKSPDLGWSQLGGMPFLRPGWHRSLIWIFPECFLPRFLWSESVERVCEVSGEKAQAWVSKHRDSLT